MSDGPPFALDKLGVTMIAGLGLVLMPLILAWTIWKLTHGLHIEQSTPVELVFVVLSALLAALTVRVTARELRGAVGVRFDEQGVSRGSVSWRWSAVEELAAPRFGVLELRDAQGRVLTLCTYLFEQPKHVRDHIAARTGKPAPEQTLSRSRR